jgi:GNAT superfamily N-acetyltransferase
VSRVEPLADHDLDRFRCGNDELDEWLRRHARTATGQGTRTYVLIDAEGAVVGYFALAPHFLNRDEAPPKLGRGAPGQIPAILLAKLAVASSIQAQGLGADLLVVALGTVIEAARKAGGRIVVVDAIDDAARRFYEHHYFQSLPNNPRRLLMKLSTAAQALGVPWP